MGCRSGGCPRCTPDSASRGTRSLIVFPYGATYYKVCDGVNGQSVTSVTSVTRKPTPHNTLISILKVRFNVRVTAEAPQRSAPEKGDRLTAAAVEFIEAASGKM